MVYKKEIAQLEARVLTVLSRMSHEQLLTPLWRIIIRAVQIIDFFF